jgi:hypothetical protein
MEEEKLTWAGIMRGFADIMRGFEDSKRRSDEVWAQIAKTDAQIAKTDTQIAKVSAQIGELTKNINGISDSNGMFAEELFFNTLSEKKVFAGIHFDDVTDQFSGIKKMPDGKRLQDQFDIVMLNDVSAAIVEAKYRAREADVEKLVEKKVNNFKILFPDYKDLKIYLGLAALAFEDKAVEKAREYGIGLLQQVGDTVEYAADWEVKAY